MNKCKNNIKENYNNLINVNKLKEKYHLMRKSFCKTKRTNRRNWRNKQIKEKQNP
jgi:hypothetical protein